MDATMAAERVAAGGRWLDGHGPDGWLNVVDLADGKFNMASCDDCVLGQVYRNNRMEAPGYTYARVYLLGGSLELTRDLGFTAPEQDWHAGIALLENAWRGYIEARRLAEVPVPELV